MNWMKHNNGKTLEDAINEWKKIKFEKKIISKEKI